MVSLHLQYINGNYEAPGIAPYLHDLWRWRWHHHSRNGTIHSLPDRVSAKTSDLQLWRICSWLRGRMMGKVDNDSFFLGSSARPQAKGSIWQPVLVLCAMSPSSQEAYTSSHLSENHRRISDSVWDSIFWFSSDNLARTSGQLCAMAQSVCGVDVACIVTQCRVSSPQYFGISIRGTLF